MQKAVYGAMSRVFAIVLAVLAVALIVAGNYAHSFITAQLAQEAISMPSEESIASLSEESQAALTPYIGQELLTGPQAKVFADNYIWEHMQNIADGRTYEDVSGEYTALSKDENADEEELATLGAQRQQLFMGDTLRGTLLSAYGWWLIGSIALYVGIGAGVAAVVLAVLGWGPLSPNKALATVKA